MLRLLDDKTSQDRLWTTDKPEINGNLKPVSCSFLLFFQPPLNTYYVPGIVQSIGNTKIRQNLPVNMFLYPQPNVYQEK